VKGSRTESLGVQFHLRPLRLLDPVDILSKAYPTPLPCLKKPYYIHYLRLQD